MASAPTDTVGICSVAWPRLGQAELRKLAMLPVPPPSFPRLTHALGRGALHLLSWLLVTRSSLGCHRFRASPLSPLVCAQSHLLPSSPTWSLTCLPHRGWSSTSQEFKTPTQGLLHP